MVNSADGRVQVAAPSGDTETSAEHSPTLGIVGVVLAFLFWPAGLVLSILAILRSPRGTTGRVLGVTGTIVAGIAGAATVVVTVGVLFLWSNTGDTPVAGSASTPAEWQGNTQAYSLDERATVPTSGGPGAVVTAADDSDAYVATYDGSTIATIDLATGKIDHTVDAEGEIRRLVADPTTGTVLALTPYALIRVNTADGTASSSQGFLNATGVAIDAQNSKVYVTDAGQGTGDDGAKGVDDRLVVLDLATLDVLAEVPLPRVPQSVVADLSTGHLFIPTASDNQGEVVVVDMSSDRVVDTIPAGAFPFSATIDTADGMVLVPNKADGTVTVIDTVSLEALTVAVGGSPAWVAVDEGRGRAYVADDEDGRVTILSTGSWQRAGELQTGKAIGGIAVSPGSGVLVVTFPFDDQVGIFAPSEAP